MAKIEMENDGPWRNAFCARGGAINGPAKRIASQVIEHKNNCEGRNGQCLIDCGMKRFADTRQDKKTT